MKVKSAYVSILNQPHNRQQLAVLVDLTEQAVYKALKDNDDDGVLTKWYYLMAMSKILGVAIDQILEESRNNNTSQVRPVQAPKKQFNKSKTHKPKRKKVAA